MKDRILTYWNKHKKMMGVSLLGAIVSWFIAWGFGWIVPSSPVNVTGLPQKELSCILNYSYPMITKRTSDSHFQILYDGNTVEDPFFHSITISNTGNYAINNDDFKDHFSISFLGCKRIVNAKITNASNQQLFNEVLEKASFDGITIMFADFFLNPGEQFSVNIITDNKPETIKYNARISDISNLTLRNTPKEKKIERISIILGIACLVVVFLTVFFVWTRVQDKKMKKQMEQLHTQYVQNKENDNEDT